MKANNVNFSLIFSLLVLFSCKVNTPNTGKLPQKNIAIGSYGGFTGMNEKHIYLRNGQVLKYQKMTNEPPKITFEKQISKKQARLMFKTINKMKFTEEAFAEPGNINTYIQRNRWLRKDDYYQWDYQLDSSDRNFKLITKLLNFTH